MTTGRERPIRYSEWARNEAGVTEPPEGKKTTGWNVGGPPTERPPADYFNWHQNSVGQWTKFLDQLFQNTFLIDSSGTDGLECTHNPGVGNEGSFAVTPGTFIDQDGLKIVDNDGDTNVRTADGSRGAPHTGTSYRIDAIVVSSNATANTKTYILIEDVITNPPADNQTILSYPIVAPVAGTYTLADIGIVHTPRNTGDPSIVRVVDGKQALGPGEYNPLQLQNAIDEVNAAGGGTVFLVGDNWGDYAGDLISIKSGVVIDGTALRQMRAPFGSPNFYMLQFEGQGKTNGTIAGGLANQTIADPTIDFRDYGINSLVRVNAGTNAGDYLIDDIPSGGGAPGDTAHLVNLDHTPAGLLDQAAVNFTVFVYKAGIRNLEMQCENLTLPAVDPLTAAIKFSDTHTCFLHNVIIDNLKINPAAIDLPTGILLREDNYNFDIFGCRTVQNITAALQSDPFVSTNINDEYRILDNDWGDATVNIAVGAGGAGLYRDNLVALPSGIPIEIVSQVLPTNTIANILPRVSEVRYLATPQLIPGAGTTTILFNGLHLTEGGIFYTVGTGVFAIPRAMVLRIQAALYTASAAWALYDTLELKLEVNTVDVARLDTYVAQVADPGSFTACMLTGSVVYSFAVGDNIRIQVTSATVGARNLAGIAVNKMQTFVSMNEIDS